MALELNVTAELQAELASVARKVFWWGSPQEALSDIGRFVAQVMVYGDWQDVHKVMQALGEQAFEKVLDAPPPGVFDQKSWNYWHLFFHRVPIPPLPKRRI